MAFVFTYQNKEYINFFGYDAFDFHARQYDAFTGRFNSVDPKNQFASGYAGMGNNPVSYIDPDGRNPLFIGAFVAIFANTAIKMAQGKPINSMWDFLKPGIAGAVGGGLGSFAPIGVLPGMAYGAGSGAVTGSINSALNGGNIGQGALYGAIGGGVFGGISGGIQANNLGADIWTGYRAPHYLYTSEVGSVASSIESINSQKYLDDLFELNYSDVGGVNMITKGHVPLKYKYEQGYFVGPKGSAYAVTESSIWKGGSSSRIFFAPAAFRTKELLAFSMAHELGHVVHANLGLSANASKGTDLIEKLLDTDGHIAIQHMTYNLANLNSWATIRLPQQGSYALGFHLPEPSLYNPIKNLIRKIIFPK